MSPRTHRRALARLALLAAATALAASGCIGPLASPTPVPASGDTNTELRQVGQFTSVSVDGPLNVVLASGTGVEVQIEAAANLLPLVTTDLAGTDLAIGVAAPGFVSAKPVTVRITSPLVTSLSLDGGAQGTMEVMASSMTVSVSGGAVLRGIGTVQQLTVTTLGGSDAQLGELTADTGLIRAAGGAKATLKVVEQLTGTADSGSVITLVVAPVAQSVTTTGGAKVVGP
ncbi:MAG: GIN domain-containing protein [Candidatus Limnocylindrales bacterium]